MNRSLRAKMIAGVGIAAMLTGATLTVMPSLAGATHVEPVEQEGNANCNSLGFSIEADSDDGKAGDSGTASGGGLIVHWTFNIDGTIDFEVDEESDYLVSAAVVKQGNYAHIYSYDPATSGDEGLTGPPSAPNFDNEFSHVGFCSDGTENTTTTEEETTTTEEETTTTEEETTTTVEETTTTEGEVLGTSTIPDETTSTEAEVLSGAVTTAGPEVLDNTVTALPATGSVADRLAPVGIALMILGAILVGGSRRSLLARN